MTNASPSIDDSEVVLAYRAKKSQQDYLECFKGWERKLQEKPCPTASEKCKSNILLEAQHELSKTGYSPDPWIENTVRNLLEPKLRQLVERLETAEKGASDEAEAERVKRLSELELLGAPSAPLERKFLFTGHVVYILFQYQNNGEGLLAAHQKEFINKFAKATSAIKNVTGRIRRDALLQRQMTTEQISLLKDIEQQHTDALSMMSELFNDSTQKSLVEDTYMVVQKQFIWTVSFECLRLFGHVSAEVIREFLTLKETHYLARYRAVGEQAQSAVDSAHDLSTSAHDPSTSAHDPSTSAHDPSTSGHDLSTHEAERKRFDRIWKGVVPAVKRRTKTQPIRHVIKLFNSDPRLARSAPKPT